MFQPIFFIYIFGYYRPICWLLRKGEISGGGPRSKGGIPSSGGGGMPISGGGIFKGGGGKMLEREGGGGGGGGSKVGIPRVGKDCSEGEFIVNGGGGGGGNR